MLVRRGTLAAILANLALLAATAQAAQVVTLSDGTGSEAAREAARLCNETVAVVGSSAVTAKLDRALSLAESAVKANDRDAKAHFAIFCSLGRKAQLEGADIESLANLDRIREELDRALEIEPEFVDALVAKGRLLASLPWMLGGDADEGERLVRRALELDPSSPVAPLHLAHVLIDQGQAVEARKLARPAIERAERSPERYVRAEAKDLEARLESEA
jgi:tetratricopeptide (TPR) repeat protein